MDMYHRYILSGLDRQTFRMAEVAFRMSVGNPSILSMYSELGIDYSDPRYARFKAPKFSGGSIEHSIRKSGGFKALNEELASIYKVDGAVSELLTVRLIASILGMYDPILPGCKASNGGPSSPTASGIFAKITDVVGDVVVESTDHYYEYMLETAMEHSNSLAVAIDCPEQVGSGS